MEDPRAERVRPATPEPPPATPWGDRLIRWSTIAVVVAVAGVAAVVSYQHAYELVHSHGETGSAARLVPFTVDGVLYSSSMVLLQAARAGQRAPRLAYLGLGGGIVATIAANVAHGAGHGWVGALVSAWPAVALIGSYELLMLVIRRGAAAPGVAAVSHLWPEESRCPHEVALTADEAIVTAFLHARDCLHDEPSQRQLATAYRVSRDKVAKLVGDLDGSAKLAEPSELNGDGARP